MATVNRRREGKDEQAAPDEERQDMSKRYAKLAQTLGLHDAFIEQLRVRGPAAIVARAERTDASGGLGLLLSMAAHLGKWMDDKAASGQPPKPGEIADAMEAIAEGAGVEKELAMRLLGSVQDAFQATAMQLQSGVSKQPTEGDDDARRRE